MTQVIVALMSAISSIAVAILGASWFTPDLLRLDVFFPTKEVQLLDDFVFVHFEDYREKGGEPVESYTNPYSKQPIAVYDKATYVEYAWLRRTNANYTVRLTTRGAAPEIRAISPELKPAHMESTQTGDQILTADMALDQSPEFWFSGRTPNPKTVYIYRNGYQGRNSFGGKDVRYKTDRLTFVYDFSSLSDWQNMFAVTPAACMKKASEDSFRPIDSVKWRGGIVIVEAFDLQPGDKIRIFWTWNRLGPQEEAFATVSCADTL